MPEMDGIEATRQIRGAKSRIQNPEVPIIALTAHAMKEDQKRCLDAGMNDYLAKPVQPDQLAEVISRWVPGNDGTPKVQTAAKVVKQGLDFDGAALLDRLDGDEKCYDEVIALFLQDVPRQIRSLQEAVSRGDITMAERQAHTLKGASGSVGAMGLQKVTLEIEKACKEGHLKEAGKMLDRIRAEFEELQQTLCSQKGGLL
jgi:CheY-like chemotaxis protein